MAGEDESLLDVFVVLAAKGLQETEAEIEGFVARTKKKFGEAKALEIGDGVAARLKKELKEAAAIARQGAKEIASNFNDVLAKLMRDERRDSSLTRGSSITGNQKVALAEAKHEVQAITYEFRKLSSQTDLNAEDLKELAVLFNRLQQAAVNVGEIRDQIVSLGPQVNTLSNNAYQLGQAFEDAAIGFQLNGLAGAFRGASNNITFLIQNLAQSGALTSSLGEKAAKLIPLYAGIGAAVGFIVLPPLIEWLETLNDIEVKTKDLDELIERAFSDARFEISLVLDAQSALKAIQDAKDAEDAIAEVIRQAEESENLRFKITAELDRVNERKLFQDINGMLNELQAVASKRVFDVSQPLVQLPLEPGDPGFIIPPIPEEIAKAEKIAAAIDLIRNSYALAQEQAAKGIVPTVELENARNGVRRLIDGFDELVLTGQLSAEAAEELKKGLEGLHKPLEDATEEAKRFESAQAAIVEDGLKALGLFKGISDEYKFLDAVNDGRLKNEDKILFDMQQQNAALEEQAAKARELFGKDNPLVEGAIDNREQVLQEEHRIDLVGEVLDLEEQIAEKRKDAERDAERAAKRRGDIEERIADERIKGEEKVANAQESLNDELNAQELSAQEDRIQKRIEALQKAETQSRNFQLGDVGTIAFGPDNKTEIERLQQQLKDLRESANKAADEERIAELRERIQSEREESQARIEELRSDLEEARQEEIDALNENAEEIQKLIEQLNRFENALRQNNNGGIPDVLAPGGLNAPRGGFIPEVQELRHAQEQANAQALQNIDFKSSSLEGLTEQTNRLLVTMNVTLSSLDLQPRLV